MVLLRDDVVDEVLLEQRRADERALLVILQHRAVVRHHRVRAALDGRQVAGAPDLVQQEVLETIGFGSLSMMFIINSDVEACLFGRPKRVGADKRVLVSASWRVLPGEERCFRPLLKFEILEKVSGSPCIGAIVNLPRAFILLYCWLEMSSAFTLPRFDKGQVEDWSAECEGRH